MNNKLTEILEEISEEKISNLSSISDLSELDFWDSISRVQLIVSIEEELGKSLTDSEIESISDIAFLTKIIS